MTTPIPGSYDPTSTLRALYQDADLQLTRLLATAVQDTIDNPADRLLHELRLQQQTRQVLARLNVRAMAEVDTILDTAETEGADRAATDQ